jgi:hypothetical protein
MEERKTLAGGDLGAGTNCRDQPPQMSPTGLADERADGASDGVQVSLKRRPQLTDSQEDVAGGLVCGQVDGNRQNAGPRGGIPVVATPCPRTDAMKVSSGFTVRVVNRNARSDR